MNELDRFHSEFATLVRSNPQKPVNGRIVDMAESAGKNPRIMLCTHVREMPDGSVRSSTSCEYLSHIYAGSFDPFIEMVEESHNAARKEGLFGLMRVKAEAWLEEHLTDASARKLRSRQVILEEQRKTVEAGHRLQRAIHSPDVDQRFQPKASPQQSQYSSSNPPQLQQPQLQHSQPQITTRPTASAPPLRPSISNEQIESSAIRALLEGATTEEKWAPYKAALMIQLPPYAVQEIENRLHELWQYNPKGVEIKDL